MMGGMGGLSSETIALATVVYDGLVAGTWELPRRLVGIDPLPSPAVRRSFQLGQGMGMGMGMMMMEDVEKKVETTKDGVVITITSKNPETVKKIQEHIAAMAKREAEMMEMMKKAGDSKEIKVEIKEEKKEVI